MKQKEFRKNIIYYFKVWKRIFLGGLSRSYIYKEEVIIRLLRTLFVVFAQIIFLNVIFGDNEMYVGWSKSEAYLVLGLWNLINYSGWSFFGVNLVYLESKILDGRFDFILLKPISSSWFASFSDFFIYNFVTAISGLILIIYYFIVEWDSILLINVIFGIISVFLSLFIWYSIYLFFASFTISNPRNGYLSIAKELLGVTKYPVDIFGESFKIVFYTVIPIAFLTTVPSNILIGKFSPIYLVYSFVVGIILYIIAKETWKRNVRKYTSVSS